jgi:transposase-like protein
MGMSDTPQYRDSDWLREQYVDRERTTADIAEECGVTHQTISTWLDKHGIETRFSGELTDERLADADWLREQYVDRERSAADIAEECGCHNSTIRRWLDKHGIETRSSGRDSDERLTDADWLREQYVDRRRSTVDIAEERDCHYTTVLRWLDRHGIETTVRPQIPGTTPSNEESHE